VGSFRKLKRFQYQSEWRLVCENGFGGVRKLNIGSIEDISVVVPSSDLNEEITISA
jgi:hypothetical protein